MPPPEARPGDFKRAEGEWTAGTRGGWSEAGGGTKTSTQCCTKSPRAVTAANPKFSAAGRKRLRLVLAMSLSLLDRRSCLRCGVGGSCRGHSDREVSASPSISPLRRLFGSLLLLLAARRGVLPLPITISRPRCLPVQLAVGDCAALLPPAPTALKSTTPRAARPARPRPPLPRREKRGLCFGAYRYPRTASQEHQDVIRQTILASSRDGRRSSSTLQRLWFPCSRAARADLACGADRIRRVATAKSAISGGGGAALRPAVFLRPAADSRIFGPRPSRGKVHLG